MKFSEYDGAKDKTKKVGDTRKTLDPKAAKLLKSIVGRYEGKSQEEILAAIMTVAEKNRKEGNLSDADIDGFYQLLAPMLDEEKLKILNDVVERIKKQ